MEFSGKTTLEDGHFLKEWPFSVVSLLPGHSDADNVVRVNHVVIIVLAQVDLDPVKFAGEPACFDSVVRRNRRAGLIADIGRLIGREDNALRHRSRRRRSARPARWVRRPAHEFNGSVETWYPDPWRHRSSGQHGVGRGSAGHLCRA